MLRKIRAAICDEEELYCSRLAEYLQANQSEMVEACVCSQKKELKKLLLEVPHFFQVRLVELIRAIQKLMRSSFAAEAM